MLGAILGIVALLEIAWIIIAYLVLVTKIRSEGQFSYASALCALNSRQELIRVGEIDHLGVALVRVETLVKEVRF